MRRSAGEVLRVIDDDTIEADLGIGRVFALDIRKIAAAGHGQQ